MSDLSFQSQLDDAAATMPKPRQLIERLEAFFAASFSQQCPGPPEVGTLSDRQCAFLLLLAVRYDDVVEYVQAIWDRESTLALTRADDDPRYTVDSIYAIVPPADGNDEWEMSFEPEDSDMVITHQFRGWEVTATFVVS